MKTILKRPGEVPQIVDADNELPYLQGIIGGGIETLTFAANACVLCDRDGAAKALPFNMEFCGNVFLGPVLFVGVDGDQFCDFPAADSFCSLLG